MVRLSPNRLASAFLTALLIAGGPVLAQTAPSESSPSVAVAPPSSLPAIQSTERDDTASAAPVAEPKAARGFQVEYSVGKVAVDATNASLNQLVREVARKASIKVTGNVSDERVFGHYGPSTPTAILAALLDGTGSNMLLVSDAKGSSELILTPRRGSVTPPNPNAAPQEEANADQPEDNSPPQYVPPTRTFQPPTATGRGPVIVDPNDPPDAAPEQSEDGTDANGQPNAQKTPQQIYEQLQKMMQQRQSTTPAPAPESPDQ